MHITTKSSTRIIFAPLIKITEWMGENYPVTLIKIRYFFRFNKRVNLKNPNDLNEKILFLKLFSDTSLWTDYADKYKVRDYVKSCGLENTLVNLYGVWFKADDFHLNVLPESFILKANNGAAQGSTLVVNNKSKWDENELRRIIKGWLEKKHIGALASEPQYKGMVPCVIAEELLPLEEGRKSLVDYKIWCFNGKPCYIWVCTDRDNNGTDVMTYDLNWKPMPEVSIFDSRYRRGKEIPKPKNFEKMMDIAECLSKPFPQVRLDLYNVNGNIYFGEATFSSLGGMMNFYTPEFLLEMGNMVDLNYKG